MSHLLYILGQINFACLNFKYSFFAENIHLKFSSSNVVGLGSHDKGRTHLGDIEIGRKPKP
jgi:hypothetical protein